MSHYAIGDIQGCYTEFMELLNKIQFNENEDTLWLAGDMINGGPDNLSVLRLLSSLKRKPIVILGNHDLHFLGVFYHIRSLQPDDTFEDILNASDAEELCHWLQSQSLAHYDASLNCLIVHAGIYPTWSLTETLTYAKTIQNCLNPAFPQEVRAFLQAIFGVSEEEKAKNWRFITDIFTRIRFCDKKGQLNLSYKGNIDNAPAELYPWFEYPFENPLWQSNSQSPSISVLFGHWAALEGKIKKTDSHLFPLDTGCVWGGKLSALRLEDKQWFQVTGKKYR